jgi:flagellar motor protein MotB
LPKPKRRSGGDSSNVWQIIYMDLMTIMMVFFVILWSVERAEETEKKKEDGVGISQTVGNQTVRVVNMPGDVLFKSGQKRLSGEGKDAFETLFGGDDGAQALSFDTGGLARRQLVINGHSDAVGRKKSNLRLAFERAWAVYEEIATYNKDLHDHVIICTHADNSPAAAVPVIKGKKTDEQKAAIRAARAKNRRITLEDKMVSTRPAEQ